MHLIEVGGDGIELPTSHSIMRASFKLIDMAIACQIVSTIKMLCCV